jgi:hypothetical protein
MKKCMLFIFVSMMLLSTRTWAQIEDYHPFLKEGKVWNCLMYDHRADYQEELARAYILRITFNMIVEEDSIVDGRVYKIMNYKPTYAERLYDDFNIIIPVSDVVNELRYYPKLWREEDRKVYGLDSRREEMYYDFSAEPDSVVYVGQETATKISSIDMVTANGQEFRRFNLSFDGRTGPVWIEGVGHPDAPFRVWGEEVNGGPQFQLLSCYEDGKIIFTQADFNSPSGVDGIEPVAPVLPKKGGLIYDLQGRRLQGEPKHGMYIQNGKKVMR